MKVSARNSSRERILDATFEVIAESGYQGTTLAAVTKRSGLPASSVYWHFSNKDELIAEVLERTYAKWRERGPTWSPPLGAATSLADFESLSLQAAQGVAAKPEFWSLGLILAIQQNVAEPQARERFLEIRRRARGMVAHWWREVLPAEVKLREPSLPDRLARLLMALGDGFFIEARADSTLSATELEQEIRVAVMGMLREYGALPN